MRTKFLWIGPALLVTSAAVTGISTHQSPTRKWIVHYGVGLTAKDLNSLDIAFVEPTKVDAKQLKKEVKTALVAYLSIGEAEIYRPYWPKIEKESWVLAQNQDWKNSYAVDIRSHEWRRLLLEEVIPQLLEAGFDGLILDTLDTPIGLEETDPEKYKGSKAAMASFVLSIRQKYPDILLVPNGGLEILETIAPYIDGIMVEDLYTFYDFKNKKTTTRPSRSDLWPTETVEQKLDAYLEQYQKPVFNIIYTEDPKSRLTRYAQKRCEEKGYSWYIATIDLDALGITYSR